MRPAWIRLPLLLALCLLVASTLGLGCSILGIGVSRAPEPEIDPTTPIWRRAPADALVGLEISAVATSAALTLKDVPLSSNTIRNVSEGAMPAVVSIYTTTATDYRVSLLPIPVPGLSFRFPLPGEALGSAFFVHPDGYLLSNNHVVANAVSIKARTPNQQDHEVEVIARDPVLDIALLRVVEPDGPFPYLEVGASEEVGVGDSVVAIGNPLGPGHSVSQGIISQTGRELVKLESPAGRQIEFLQTDTAINPGSSGGPLITLTGAVIGMNTAIARSAHGIAFAVPSSQILQFLENVLKGDGVADPATE
jgi:S1-C subfamily serine protease